MSTRRIAAVTLGFSLAVLAGCGSADPGQGTATSTGATASDATVADADADAASVPAALSFSAPLLPLAGESRSTTFEAASFVGKPVAFWFWAPG